MQQFRSLTKAVAAYDRLKATTARAREASGEVMEQALTVVETGGAGFLFGLLEGQIDKPEDFELAGVPYPLLAGIVGHGLAFFGIGRGMEGHMHAVANGALTAHLNGLGRKMGQEMKAKRSGVPAVRGADVSNALPPRRVVMGAGTGVSERDLLEMAQNAD